MARIETFGRYAGKNPAPTAAPAPTPDAPVVEGVLDKYNRLGRERDAALGIRRRWIRGRFARAGRERAPDLAQQAFGQPFAPPYLSQAEAVEPVDRSAALLQLQFAQHAERVARQTADQQARQAHELAGRDYLPYSSRA